MIRTIISAILIGIFLKIQGIEFSLFSWSGFGSVFCLALAFLILVEQVVIDTLQKLKIRHENDE